MINVSSSENIIRKEKKELLKPKNDVVFQSLFNQKNEEITTSFISDLLGEKVTSIKINETKELFREMPEEKLGILDLEAEINNNEKIDIEIQLIDRKNLAKRLLRYFSKLYILQKGNKYEEAKRVVIIAIIDYSFDLTKEIKKMDTIWNLREKDNSKLILTNKIEVRIIEIRKALREYKLNKDNRKAQWIMFLNDPNDEEIKEVMEKNKEIKKATVEVIKMTEDEKLEKLAWLREKAILDEYDIEAAGIDKGEKKAKISIAKKMKEKEYSINIISEITGLTIEEINNL